MAKPYVDPNERPVQGGPIDPRHMGLLSMALPSPVGDVVGLLSDAAGYAQDPKSLTWGSGLLSLAGLLPGVPHGAAKADDWRGRVYHYTKADITPETLSPRNRGAVYVSTDPRAAMYGAAAGRNESSLRGIDMNDVMNPRPISDSSVGQVGDRILPMEYRGSIYGVTVPDRVGPIPLPDKISEDQYREMLKQADALQIAGLGENATEKARRIARQTIKDGYDWSDAESALVRRKEWLPPGPRGSQIGFDYQTFEGRMYPDAKNVDGSSAAQSALKELGFDGSALLDEGSIMGATSIGIFNPRNLRSIWDAAK